MSLWRLFRNKVLHEKKTRILRHFGSTIENGGCFIYFDQHISLHKPWPIFCETRDAYLSAAGELPLCDHLLLPKQEDADLQERKLFGQLCSQQR